MTAPASLITRLQARDQALFERLMLSHASPVSARALAVTLTHLGGARASVLLALWPLVWGNGWRGVGWHALLTLVLSHLAVQLVKRTVGRPRPSCAAPISVLVAEPDRFSFPSGHAAAALSVALAYAVACPPFALPILVLAVAVGTSRVALGVHYPGDVAAGQAIALATHLLLVRGGL